MSKLIERVAGRVRALRKARKLSQEALADLCNLHRTYVGAIERGERAITLNTLERLAKALGINPEDLIAAHEK